MRRFAEVDSTNSYLLDEAGKGAPEGLVVVADVQRRGRGRRGRTWEAPAGTSLLVSVLLRPALSSGRMNLAVAAVSLAACAACEDVAGAAPGVKWPNDLVISAPQGEQKLGGILAELDLPAVVVGLGLNVDWPEAALPAGAGCLGPFDRDELLEALLAHLGARLGHWDEVAGEYRRRCVTLGRLVRVDTTAASLTGTAVDVSSDGHLLVAPAGASEPPVSVAAGDLVHLRPVLPD